MRKPNRNLVPIVLGLLALIIAGTGTAVASGGTLVHITDPINATYKAKVNANGQLRVDTSQPRTFTGRRFIFNYFSGSNGYQVLAGPTTATLSLHHITAVMQSDYTRTHQFALFQVSGATNEECTANSNFRELHRVMVAPTQAAESDFSNGLLLKPPSGSNPWCLITAFWPVDNSAISSYAVVTFSGYVYSGSFTPPTSSPEGAGSADPGAGPELLAP